MSIRFASWLLIATIAPGHIWAAGLDWEVEESEEVSVPVQVARNVRDGVLTFGDAFMDANVAAFGLAAMLMSQGSMVSADVVGLVDDNPVTQHVTKAIVSKNVAKTAYLWHVAGSESLLGSHGMETESWAVEDVASLNPLLGEEDLDALSGPLPLDPLDFVGEGMIHTRVLRPHAVLVTLGAVVVDDAILRPVAGLLRILQFRATGDGVEETGNDLVRASLETNW